MTGLDALDRELEWWARAGLRPRLWLRDDDAVRPTPQLDRLLALAREHDVPVLLAVIPVPADPRLAARLADEPLVTPAVHGHAHRNHAPAGTKSTELIAVPPHRHAGAVMAELRDSRTRLVRMFGARLSPILVPPWNRIGPDIAARLGEAGFAALSLHGWRRPVTPLPVLNTHVDLIDWRARRGIAPEAVARHLAEALGAARLRGGEPVGLLAHHLAHDATAWRALEGLVGHLAARHGPLFHPAGALLAPPAHPS